jgi:glucokinase
MNEIMIVSDVGGTNGRFGIAKFSEGKKLPEISEIRVYPCKEYITFTDMIAEYMGNLKGEIPKTARFAISGEMTPRRGNLWHFNWDIRAEELEQKLGFDQVTLMNDFEALVYAVPHLPKNELLTITDFEKGLENGPFSVCGAGSGLGGSIGIPIDKTVKVVSTEIGHISFAPRSNIEMKLLKHTRKSFNHVSLESFLSGSGLVRIYDFIAGAGVKKMTAPEITAAAKDDDNCSKAINVFLSILYSAAGDIALAQGARGGLYIGGGIVPKIADQINKKDFLKLFRDKGPMSAYAEKIPVHIITSDMPALLGAAIASVE